MRRTRRRRGVGAAQFLRSVRSLPSLGLVPNLVDVVGRRASRAARCLRSSAGVRSGLRRTNRARCPARSSLLRLRIAAAYFLSSPSISLNAASGTPPASSAGVVPSRVLPTRIRRRGSPAACRAPAPPATANLGEFGGEVVEVDAVDAACRPRRAARVARLPGSVRPRRRGPRPAGGRSGGRRRRGSRRSRRQGRRRSARAGAASASAGRVGVLDGVVEHRVQGGVQQRGDQAGGV